MTTVKGNLFQVECWEKYPNGHHLMCLWLRGKWQRKWQRLWKGKQTLIGISFMKIKEIMRKGG